MSDKPDPLEKLRLLGTFLLLELMPPYKTLRLIRRIFVYTTAVCVWIYISILLFK